MSLPRRWWSHLSGLAIWLAAGALIGFLLGSVAIGIAAALAIYVAHMLYNLFIIEETLDGGGSRPLFETRGLWAEVGARAVRLKSRSRSRKKRYHRLLREVRESTGAIGDAGIILNAESEIVWFNPAATRLLGLDSRRDIGSRVDNLIRHPDFTAYLVEASGTSIKIPSPHTPDGTLQVQLIPYGKNQRLLIFRDVTHETRLERMRRDFVANASHELRSPLTVIAGYLDALAEEQELQEDWNVPIAEMQRQSHRMTQILRDLIELTQLESAETPAGDEFVDVGEMLRKIVAEFKGRKQLPQPALHLETDAALLGSDTELHSVFHNLIANATRFTPNDGKVDVFWREDDGQAVFDVVDTGIGIPAEHIPRLTERFYRVDKGRSRATGGTGLGLAIVKHALQRHGGDLEIVSVEGEGSRFSCRFDSTRVVVRRNAKGSIV